jgi:hypothetical protein
MAIGFSGGANAASASQSATAPIERAARRGERLLRLQYDGELGKTEAAA